MGQWDTIAVKKNEVYHLKQEKRFAIKLLVEKWRDCFMMLHAKKSMLDIFVCYLFFITGLFLLDENDMVSTSIGIILLSIRMLQFVLTYLYDHDKIQSKHEVLAEYLYSNSTIVGFLTIGAYSLYCYSQSLLAITLAITAIVAGAGIKSTVDFWAKKMSDKDNKDARIQKDD